MFKRDNKPAAPVLWVPSAYFSMGLAYVALNSATAIMFKNLGMDNGSAAEWASYLILAYTVKPLFAPLVEMYRTKKFFVLVAQLLVGLGFVGVASALGLPHGMAVVMALLWIISFLGATQDIATDGVYITALTGKAQSLYCGVQSLAWNLAPILVAGGMVYLSGYLHTEVFGHDAKVAGAAWADAWSVIFYIIAAIALLMPAWHWFMMPEGARAADTPESVKAAAAILKDSFISLFRKKDIWLMIAFSFLFRSSICFLDKIGPFFMVDPRERGGLGMSNEMLGLVYGTYGLVAVLAGALLGGIYVARRGLKPSLMLLCCAVNLPGIAFVLLAVYQPTSMVWIAAGVMFDKFLFGFGAVGYNIYVMQQMAPGKFSTTHYAFATGLNGLCMLLGGALSGHLQEMMGYIHYFGFVMVAAIPSFIVVWLAPFNHAEPQHVSMPVTGAGTTQKEQAA